MSTAGLDALFEQAALLPAGQRDAFLAFAAQERARRAALSACANPAELAQRIDPKYVITPAVRTIAEHLEQAITTRGARLIITMPPQEGKSTAAVHTVLRALQRNPDTRILYISYSEDLAIQASMAARDLIAAHGSDARDPLTGQRMPDRLGISLSADKSAAGSWRVKGRKGGMVAVGIRGTITGKAADLIIVDDPLKGMEAADSNAERARVISGWQGNISTRLAPGAPVIVINTRWHEQDLTGWLLAQDATLPEDEREWELVNIPAVAETGLPDALGREPGVALESARGERDWVRIRRNAGERVWYALYQGSPSPLGGTLISSSWFDMYRLAAEPPLYRRVVGVDPAETGQGDEAGIVAAGLTADGTVVLTDDWSGLMSSAEWPRKACLLALATGASELVFEAYGAPKTYERTLKTAYRELVAEAGESGVVEGIRVPADCPFLVQPWTGRGNAEVRSVGLRNSLSVGRARAVGHKVATLEWQAVRWQSGQHCPDRFAAATVAFDVLAGGGGTVVSASPAGWGDMPSGIGSTR